MVFASMRGEIRKACGACAMTVKKLEQFKCDYFPIGAQVLIDANWLQQTLRENEEQIRTQNKAIRALNIENAVLRAKNAMNDIESDAVCRIDVRG